MKLELVLHRRTVVRALVLASLVLVGASIAGQVVRFAVAEEPGVWDLVYLDTEQSFPTYAQVVLLLTCCLLLLFVAKLASLAGAAARGWWALALLFLLLSCDESIGLHERMHEQGALKDLDLAGPFYFGWVVVGIPLVILVAVAFSGFLRRLDASSRNALLAAGALYVGGALGVELLAGAYVDGHGADTAFYGIVLVSAEESLEMAGLIVLIWALLRHLERYAPALSLVLDSPERNATS